MESVANLRGEHPGAQSPTFCDIHVTNFPKAPLEDVWEGHILLPPPPPPIKTNNGMSRSATGNKQTGRNV